MIYLQKILFQKSNMNNLKVLILTKIWIFQCWIGQIENLDNFECLKFIKNHVFGFENSNKITIFDNVEKDYLDLGNCICHTKVGTTEFESWWFSIWIFQTHTHSTDRTWDTFRAGVKEGIQIPSRYRDPNINKPFSKPNIEAKKLISRVNFSGN